ncbi:MAG TPA: hypothetical protein VMT95_12475 [Candidatus Binatia bacterium]|nr:hypothetical protein [Candidatus Binatia bacterium]
MKNLSFVLLAAGMAACGGGSATTSTIPAQPIAGQSEGAARDTRLVDVSDHAEERLIYVSDHANNLIDVFGRGKLRTITSGVSKPVGLFVDALHNLWVANPGANDVLVFRRGSKTPSETLEDSNQPNDVAVCHDGTAFVADSLNLGGVAVYPPGHTAPTRRLEAQRSGQGGIEFYVACDNAGNVFATGMIGASPFAATVGWRHARESGYYLLKPAASSEGGIKATADRRLLIPMNTGPSQGAIVEFTEGGKPTGRAIRTGSDLWGDIALNGNQSDIYGVVTAKDVVAVRKFPGGGFVREFTSGNLAQPEGIAVDPGD